MNPYAVRKYLLSSGIRPSKKLGQNFLVDQNVARRLVKLLDAKSGEVFLEIGAGTGALTVPLAEESVEIFAVEIDGRLVKILRATLKGLQNVHVIEKNILALDLRALVERGGVRRIQVTGNLPYSITTQIILHLLRNRFCIGRALLTVQKEYAERLLAQPGTRRYGSLSVLVQSYAVVEQVASISPRCFFPRPEVSSAVLRMEFLDTPAVRVRNEACFEATVRAAFSHRRKMLVNSLSESTGLERARLLRLLELASIDGTRRAEQLRLEELARLADVFYDESVALSLGGREREEN